MAEQAVSMPYVASSGRAFLLRRAVAADSGSLMHAVDCVAREGRYLARARFSVDTQEHARYITTSHGQGGLILLAVDQAGVEQVVGWAMLRRAVPDYLQHTAELGMGIVAEHRGIGLGAALLNSSLQWASGEGIEKVKLGVRATNKPARALYEKFGFVEEGRRIRDIKDKLGRYDDIVKMSCFLSRLSPVGAKGPEVEA